jgi:hypothetical protein
MTEEKKLEVSEEMRFKSIANKISRVLSTFTKQEMGNRVTQFNMQGLTDIINSILNNSEIVRFTEGKDIKE